MAASGHGYGNSVSSLLLLWSYQQLSLSLFSVTLEVFSWLDVRVCLDTLLIVADHAAQELDLPHVLSQQKAVVLGDPAQESSL